MITLNRIYNLFRVLSLDVVFGAVIMSKFMANLLGILVPIPVYAALAIAVWIIYTWDHLSDAKSLENPSTYRHQWHKKHYKVLLLSLVIALIIGVMLVFFLPIQTIFHGIVASGLVLIYFLLIRFWEGFAYKEIISALVYSLGVFVGPISLSYNGVGLLEIMLFLNVLFIALINLLIFSLFEQKTDKTDGFKSIIHTLGKKATTIIYLLFLLSVTIDILLLIVFHIDVQTVIILFCMSSILLSLNVWSAYFGRNEAYRILGDGVFLIPLITVV